MQRCRGTLSRRDVVQAGLMGAAGFGLADLLRAEALARPPGSANAKSMIVLWLWGGPSHLETFDLKPDAPSEYRGEFRPIPTNVPGVEISEHLPRLSQLADQFALVRSLHHDSNGHVNSTHTMMTGYAGEAIETPPFQPKYPDVRAVIHHLQGPQQARVPAQVALPGAKYYGAAHLGSHLEPMVVSGDPNSPEFTVPGLSVEEALRPRFEQRLDLIKQFDLRRREIDAAGSATSLDRFQEQAASILTSDAARKAFDLSLESPLVRDRYGRTHVGQRCLLARRLVESGVRLVTVDFSSVTGQKAFSWDDHASVWNIFEQMKIRLPVLDQVVAALLQDLADRNLSDEVLVAVMGEMSHTPRLSDFNGQPGREHWAQTMSVLLAGGGLRMGQAVGATSRNGDEPAVRPYTPNDLLATWYHAFGIPLDTAFRDRAGRPTPILPQGRPIEELI